MRFTRFAPALLLGGCLGLLFFPWLGDVSGYRICFKVYDRASPDITPIAAGILMLLALYPPLLLVGTLAALLNAPSDSRGAALGSVAFVLLVVLSLAYGLVIFQSARMLQEFTPAFYLSHAATLATTFLSVRESRRMW